MVLIIPGRWRNISANLATLRVGRFIEKRFTLVILAWYLEGMENNNTAKTKQMYRAHNAQGAFLGSFVATSAKAAARQLRRDWAVATGDVVTVCAVSGNDRVT